jgi:tetratricopeptide (TPR) repeat protein
MKKYIIVAIIFLLTNVSKADESPSDFQNYLTGMKFYNDGDYGNAIKPLTDSVNSNSLKPNLEVYAVIALAVIDENNSKQKDSLDLVTNFLTKNENDLSDDEKKDLLVMQSRLCRAKEIGRLTDSYSIAARAFKIAPDDSSVLLNYAVAGLQYEGALREKALKDSANKENLLSKASTILSDSLIATEKIITLNPGKEMMSQALNTKGRIQYLDGNFDEAEKSFKKAYLLVDKPIFHRNRGWALFGGLSKRKHGREKYEILNDALSEFETALNAGDDDPVTKSQIPNLQSEVKKLSAKYEKTPTEQITKTK